MPKKVIEYDEQGSSERQVLDRVAGDLTLLLLNFIGDPCNTESLLAAASDAEMCVGEATDWVSGWSVKTQMGRRSIRVTTSHKRGAGKVVVMIGGAEPRKRYVGVRDVLVSKG